MKIPSLRCLTTFYSPSTQATSLLSQPQQIPPFPIAIRLASKMSGLFDAGILEDWCGGRKEAGKEGDRTTIDAQSIFSEFGENISLSDLDDCPFMDVFTDLSEYLENDQNVEDILGPELFKYEVEKMITEEKTLPHEEIPLNPDHDDYTLKRPRLSSSDNELSVDQHTPKRRCLSSSSSTTSSTSMKYKSNYREQRDKNNVASKRSRATKKQKYNDMEIQAIHLEEQNQLLRRKVLEMEELAKEMNSVLVKNIANRQ